ncbi:MAG: methyltransferase [Myxococcota bacterium]
MSDEQMRPEIGLAERLGEPVTRDQIVGEWDVFQLKKGHRFSTDDLLVAWAAIDANPKATKLLDIGAGIGSVSLMTLYAMPGEATMTMIEVQTPSHLLARASIRANALTDRVTAIHGDLRDVTDRVVAEQGTFQIVTGSPPYIPLGMGVVSPHPQRAGARMELRGDVFDYCRAAAKALDADGTFCFCHASGDARPEPAIRAAGLMLITRQDVVFRAGQPPTISLFTCRRSGPREDRAPLVVRDKRGEWTEEYIALRQTMTTRGW